jgi:hypothetical protein
MMHRIALLASLCIPAVCVAASDIETDETQWETTSSDVSDVNEGPLRILESPPGKPAHHHVNRLTITPDSVESGWIAMDQCHYDIDPVPLVEITYAPEKTRGLRVTRTENIATATADGHVVTLKEVGRQATVCVKAETRALTPRGDGYVLRSGPFMRRFLDGYYPMHVTLDIRYPGALELKDLYPPPGPGIRHTQYPGRLVLDLWFEGILETRFRFRDSPTP